MVAQGARTGYFLFRHIPGKVPELTGKDVQPVTTRAEISADTGQAVVVFQFTERGQRIFREITRREAERGRLVGGNCAPSPPPAAQHFAIVLDRRIKSAPYIDYCKNPEGIPADNGAEIDFGPGGSVREARRLVVLQTRRAACKAHTIPVGGPRVLVPVPNRDVSGSARPEVRRPGSDPCLSRCEERRGRIDRRSLRPRSSCCSSAYCVNRGDKAGAATSWGQTLASGVAKSDLAEVEIAQALQPEPQPPMSSDGVDSSTWNECPQPQDETAFGLLIANPDWWIVST